MGCSKSSTKDDYYGDNNILSDNQEVISKLIEDKNNENLIFSKQQEIKGGQEKTNSKRSKEKANENIPFQNQEKKIENINIKQKEEINYKNTSNSKQKKIKEQKLLFLNQEEIKNENKSLQEQEMEKEKENKSISKNEGIKENKIIFSTIKEDLKDDDKKIDIKVEIKEDDNKKIDIKEETKEDNNKKINIKDIIKEEDNKKINIKDIIKEEDNNKIDIKEEKKDNDNKILSKNKILNEKSESVLSKEHKLENLFFPKFTHRIDEFVIMKDDPLRKYNYFKIDFTKCNYIFITPEPLIQKFSSFYSKKLKDSLIFFPKDFKQAEELLNDYENEIGNKENWIVIAPCEELEENISNYNENKDIYCFLGYCLAFNHEHNIDFFYKFSKFYGIVESSEELIEKLFKLNYIVYYRKKQNYEIIEDRDNIFELKYDTKLLVDYDNDGSKKSIIEDKLATLYQFKIHKEKCYFLFIQSFTLLNKYIEEKNYNFFNNIIKKFAMLIVANDEIEKAITASNLLKHLHILYFYFSNYPYLYGVLTDEEINEIITQCKGDLGENELLANYGAGCNLLVKIAYVLAFGADNGLSILNYKKELLIMLQKLLIEMICSHDQLIYKSNFSELSEYYQIKNYLRDIDFCLSKVIVDIIIDSCQNYPLKPEIKITFFTNDVRYYFYRSYTALITTFGKKNEDEQIKAYNKAIKYNDIIVLGDKQFHDTINKMNISSENIYYLNENEFSNFFQTPKKINGKYKICKYFVIMNEKYGNIYLETIRYISNVFGIKFAVIIYIMNKTIKINKEIIQHPFLHIVLTYSEKDILNYYLDSLIRIKEINIHYIEENDALKKNYK